MSRSLSGLRSASGQVNKQEGHTLPTSNGSTEYKGILSPVECRQLKPKEILECSLWLLGSGGGPQNEGERNNTCMHSNCFKISFLKP